MNETIGGILYPVAIQWLSVTGPCVGFMNGTMGVYQEACWTPVMIFRYKLISSTDRLIRYASNSV